MLFQTGHLYYNVDFMIKNSLIFLLSSFSFFLLYLLYNEPSASQKEHALMALYDARSATHLYALNNKHTDTVKTMLEFDTVHLIHQYNKDIFANNGLDRICSDWHKYIKEITIKHLAKYDNNETYQVSYYQQVKLNMKLLDSCLNEKK